MTRRLVYNFDFLESYKVVDNNLGGFAVVIYFIPSTPAYVYSTFKALQYQCFNHSPEHFALRTFRTREEAENEMNCISDTFISLSEV